MQINEADSVMILHNYSCRVRTVSRFFMPSAYNKPPRLFHDKNGFTLLHLYQQLLMNFARFYNLDIFFSCSSWPSSLLRDRQLNPIAKTDIIRILIKLTIRSSSELADRKRNSIVTTEWLNARVTLVLRINIIQNLSFPSCVVNQKVSRIHCAQETFHVTCTFRKTWTISVAMDFFNTHCWIQLDGLNIFLTQP